MGIRQFLRKSFVKRSTYNRSVEENLQFKELMRNLTGSKAEYFQDLWVLSEKEYKQNGFFIEFGATNGLDASNTWILEKMFGWTGILAEPNALYKKSLKENRNCSIDFRVVWDSSTNPVDFVEFDEAYLSVARDDLREELSDKLSGATFNQIETVSLLDLLECYEAPKHIDFLSVDVEGSEFRILNEFFKTTKYIVDLIVVEHNWRDENSDLLNLITSKGYERVYLKNSYRDYWFKRINFSKEK